MEGEGMKNYKELQVWQKPKRLTIDVYKATEAFPRPEQFGLTNQVQRATVSVTNPESRIP